MPLHFTAWNQALSKWGAHLPLDLHYEWAGTPTRQIARMLNDKFGWSMPPDEVVDLKEAAYLNVMSTVQPIPSVFEVIVNHHGQIPFAVVSGSSHQTVVDTLTHLKILDRFEYIVGAEDYANGKPAPDCFLQGAKLLGIDPSKCLAFEDAELGIQSAHAAGMDCATVDSRTGVLTWPRAK